MAGSYGRKCWRNHQTALYPVCLQPHCMCYSSDTISMSSLVKHLLNHLPIFCSWMFIFLLLSFDSSLYIVDKSHLSGRLFAIICSQCLSCLVILLTVSFGEQFFILKKSSLSSFPFVIMLSTLFQRNICLT